MKITFVSSLSVLILSASVVTARQDPKPAPEPAKEKLEAVIVQIEGVVDVKRPDDKDWIPAEVNMKLPEGSEICTAYAATATLLFGKASKVVVQPLAQAKIETLVKKDEKTVETEVNLKFGGAEIDIKQSDIKTDMKVAMPNSTTSVSGSSATCYAWANQRDAWRFIMMRVHTGTWVGQYEQREEVVPGVGEAPPEVVDPEEPPPPPMEGFVLDGGGVICNDGRMDVDLMNHFMAAVAQDFGRPESETYSPTGMMENVDPMMTQPMYEETSTQVSPDAWRSTQPPLLPGPPPPP